MSSTDIFFMSIYFKTLFPQNWENLFVSHYEPQRPTKMSMQPRSLVAQKFLLGIALSNGSVRIFILVFVMIFAIQIGFPHVCTDQQICFPFHYPILLHGRLSLMTENFHQFYDSHMTIETILMLV